MVPFIHKHPIRYIYGAKKFESLSVCLSVPNFDPNYLINTRIQIIYGKVCLFGHLSCFGNPVFSFQSQKMSFFFKFKCFRLKTHFCQKIITLTCNIRRGYEICYTNFTSIYFVRNFKILSL